MKNFTERLSRNPGSTGRRVLVNTGALASANLWRIVVSFLVQLLVARGLGLEALGHYTVAMAYLNISQVLCEMGLPLWIIRRLAQSPDLRPVYFRRAVLLQVSAALLLWALLAGLVMLLPYPPNLRTALFWVGASLPLFAITSATATIFQAAERMPLAFVIEFVTNLLILLLSIWLLWQGQGVADLLFVVAVSQGIGMILGLAILLGGRLLSPPQDREALQNSETPPLGEMVRGALAFFGLSLTDVLLQRLDILLLSLLGDARLLGAYSAAYNLVRVAIKLLQSLWRGVYPTLARLYPMSPQQAMTVAMRLLIVGAALSTIGALLVTVMPTTILQVIYGAESGVMGRSATGNNAMAGDNAATALAWLIWQAPLFFVELYASTWLLVISRANQALWLALLHVLLLVVLLPAGALMAGATGAAWGTLAAQGLATGITLWFIRRTMDWQSTARPMH